MADHSKIEWTDATWNPITGCSVVSPGCTNCYAMRLAGTRLKHHPSRAGLTRDTKGGPVWTGKVRLNRQWMTQPIEWKKPKLIFPCAHGDLFHPDVPDEWILDVFTVMAIAHWHTYQVTTKRPERMRDFVSNSASLLEDIYANWYSFDGGSCEVQSWPPRNIWLGTSVEDAQRASQRYWPMFDIASEGWITWASYEPALDAINWSGWKFLRWLVSGGESGPGARPSQVEWHRAARDFCAEHGIAYLFKQWGNYLPAGQIMADGRPWAPVNGPALHAIKAITGRFLDGVEHNGYPQERP